MDVDMTTSAGNDSTGRWVDAMSEYYLEEPPWQFYLFNVC